MKIIFLQFFINQNELVQITADNYSRNWQWKLPSDYPFEVKFLHWKLQHPTESSPQKFLFNTPRIPVILHFPINPGRKEMLTEIFRRSTVSNYKWFKSRSSRIFRHFPDLLQEFNSSTHRYQLRKTEGTWYCRGMLSSSQRKQSWHHEMSFCSSLSELKRQL